MTGISEPALDGPGLEETDHVGPWPAFVDLFAAAALIFLVFFTVMAFSFIKARIDSGPLVSELLTALQQQHRLSAVREGSDVLIVLEEQVTFPSSRFRLEDLKPEGRAALRSIGDVLLKPQFSSLIREIEVVGHTDRWPFPKGSGETNWLLSAERAATVTQFLVDSVSINPCIVIPSGRGEYFPRDHQSRTLKSSDALNARDRRIELLLHPAIAGEARQGRSGCVGSAMQSVR